MLFGREPAAIMAALQAAIALAIAFGLDLSDEQIGAILAVVATIAGLIVRSQVTPVAQVAQNGV